MHGPLAEALEGQGHALAPALLVSENKYKTRVFVAQKTIGIMADPIDSALYASHSTPVSK